MATKIEIENSKGGSFVFPVTPDSYEIPTESGDTTVVVNDLGELNLKGKRGLKRISWSSFFPTDWLEIYQVSEGELQEPAFYRDELDRLLAEKDTVILNITGVVSIAVTLSSFAWGQNDGTGDIAYSVTFTEDRQVNTPTVKQQTTKRPTKSVTSHMYKWKKDDTWKKVAKKETGDSANYQKIKNINKSRITKAVKAYKKKHNVQMVKDEVALVGESILIK